MNIRSKITLPMILLPFISSIVVLLVCVILFTQVIEETQTERMTSAANTFENDLENRKHDVQQAARAIASDNILINDLKKTEQIYERTKELKDETGVDFTIVTDKKGKAIYSTLDTDNIGNAFEYFNESDKVSGVSTLIVDRGETNHLSIQSASPIQDADGKLLGTAIAGFRIDTKEYVDYIQKLTGSEVSISLENIRLATTIKDSNGERVIGSEVKDNVWEIVSQGKSFKGTVYLENQRAIAEYRPLEKEGEVIGMFLVGLYTESTQTSILEFVVVGAIAALIIMVIAAVTGYKLSGRIVAPIRDLVDISRKVAEGNVDVDIKIEKSDETGELAHAFSDMVDCFKEQAEVLKAIAEGDYTKAITPKSSEDIVGNAIVSMIEKNNKLLNDILTTSKEVASGSTQIANSAQRLSTGSSEQAITIQNFAETIQEFQKQAQNTNDLANTTFEESTQAGLLMDVSLDFMNQMSESMREIDIGGKGIEDIIHMIDSIAFQTNILALNAAVEAARAGDKGKGFAVVADEVRNLAEKSAEAAKDTAALITSNRNKVEQGSQIAVMAEDSLSKVADIAKNNAESMKEISRASSVQTEMVDKLIQGINQISEVVEANSSAAEENAAAAEEMSAQSINLDQTVTRFKTQDSE